MYRVLYINNLDMGGVEIEPPLYSNALMIRDIL